MNPVLDPYCVVLEVKYNGFLPDYLRELINSVIAVSFVSKHRLASAKRMSDEAIGGKHHETTDPNLEYQFLAICSE